MKSKLNLPLFFLLFYLTNTYSQKDIQEYYLFLRNESSKKTKAEDKVKVSNQLIFRAQKEGNKHFFIKGIMMKAFAYYNENVDLSLKYTDVALKYCKNYQDTLFPAKIYRDKAIYLVKKKKFEEAIKNYKIAESYAKENNPILYCAVRTQLATLKSDELGDIKGALEIHKENYRTLNKSLFSKHTRYIENYVNTLIGLTYNYNVLNKTDSAYIYKNLGIKISQKINDEDTKSYFSLLGGAILLKQKKYQQSIDSLNKVLPTILKYANSNNLLWLYYLKGKANKGLQKNDKTVYYFKKVDSINQLSMHSSTLEVLESYQFLINYYTSKNDTKNELNFTKKFKTTDSIFRYNNNQLYKALQNNYEIPRLIEQHKSQSVLSKQIIILLIIIAIISISLLTIRTVRLKKQKLDYENKFNKLVNEFHIINQNSFQHTDDVDSSIEQDNSENTTTKKQFIIPQDTIDSVLKRLIEFEKQQQFIDSDMNLQKLADICNTNTKYISKIINTYKQKSVVSYINDLRIDYALEQIKKNQKLLKLSIAGLAEEFGFKNSESFGNAFSKKTGINPSTFINQLTTKKH